MNRIGIVLFACGAVVAASRPALADLAPPELPTPNSTGSKSLYRDLNAYHWDCPKDREADKRQFVADAATAAAAISDPTDRKQFTAYATALQAWFDAHTAGVPGVGTWAELDKKFKAARATFDAMPANAPTGAAEIEAAVALYTKVRAQAKAVADLEARIRTESPCPGYPDSWSALLRDGNDARDRADRQVHEVVGPALDAYQSWKSGRAVLDEAAATTYWEQLEQTMKLVDLVVATQALAPRIADLVAWHGVLSADDAALVAEAGTQLPAALDSAAARAAAQLEEVAMPPLPNNAGRAKLVKKMLASEDGALVGKVVGPKGSSTEKWTEDVEVRRDSERIWYRTYKVVRESYSTYYAWRPGTAVAIALPGVAAGELCEIWHQSFQRFKKGTPGTSKKWAPWQAWKQGYVLCKRATVASKLRIKK
jgi:hypothetical protein